MNQEWTDTTAAACQSAVREAREVRDRKPNAVSLTRPELDVLKRGQKAAGVIVAAHQSYVDREAAWWVTNHGVDPDVVVSAANLILLELAWKWDADVPFGGYAGGLLRRRLSKVMDAESGVVSIPEKAAHRVALLTRTETVLEQELGRHASAREVAARLDVSPAVVTQYRLVRDATASALPIDPWTGSVWDADEEELVDAFIDYSVESGAADRVGAGEAAAHFRRIADDVFDERDARIVRTIFGLDSAGAMKVADAARLLNEPVNRCSDVKNKFVTIMQHPRYRSIRAAWDQVS